MKTLFQLSSLQKRSVGVAPAMNVRNSLHIGDEACERGIQPGPGQTSLEVQNGGISDITKRTDVLQD